MIRHKENAAPNGSGAQDCCYNKLLIAQPADQHKNDKQLINYILVHQAHGLRDPWEYAFLQSLSRLRNPLNQTQATALAAIWQRIQRVSA